MSLFDRFTANVKRAFNDIDDPVRSSLMDAIGKCCNGHFLFSDPFLKSKLMESLNGCQCRGESLLKLVTFVSKELSPRYPS